MYSNGLLRTAEGRFSVYGVAEEGFERGKSKNNGEKSVNIAPFMVKTSTFR